MVPTGFTHQYRQLNALLEKLLTTGPPVRVLGVPCNQFGRQEPAANRTELLAGLRHVRPGAGYTPAFNLTARSDVNGGLELELYAYLKVSWSSTPTSRLFFYFFIFLMFLKYIHIFFIETSSPVKRTVTSGLFTSR